MEEGEWRLLSFLEVDNSFLTPWSFNPNASSTSKIRRYMSFQCGSFFSFDHKLAEQEPPLMADKEDETVQWMGFKIDDNKFAILEDEPLNLMADQISTSGREEEQSWSNLQEVSDEQDEETILWMGLKIHDKFAIMESPQEEPVMAEKEGTIVVGKQSTGMQPGQISDEQDETVEWIMERITDH